MVPTPIGNLEDLTERALKVLSEVDLVACEDTRHTGQLLSRLNIKKKLISYHEHNEFERANNLIQMLKNGESVAVVSDAGSPGISDPGFRVVRAAIENNIQVVPLPGANSIIPALIASGLPTDRFLFEGYLSHKSAARKRRLEELRDFPHTLIFFESPFRIGKCLENMLEVFGDRQVSVARELTKIHEEFIRGKLDKVVKNVSSRKIKGEIVIVVAGKSFTDKSNAGIDE
ncbi:MAG: 16S rRNA (cytidine(1402)-2'-O)-methyltransferase [Candidatus Zixiibacteriota bacterium]